MKVLLRDLRHWAPSLIAGAVVFIVWGLQSLSSISQDFSVFTRLENISFDWRVRLAARTNAPICEDLLAIAITDQSHTTVSQSYNAIWPWPRALHGWLVEELAAEGAKVVAFDILFLTPHETFRIQEGGREIDSDEVFGRELQEAGNVLLAASSSTEQGSWSLDAPIQLFATNCLSVGHIVADVDTDGVLRRVKAYYDDDKQGRVWHLALLAAAEYLGMDMDQALVEKDRIVLRGPQGQERIIPTDEEGYFYIDWVLGMNEGQRREIIRDFSEFVERWAQRSRGLEVPFHDVRKRIVFVGSLATGNNIADRGATPLSSLDFLFALHWNIANSIILNQFIQQSSFFTGMLLVLFVALLSAVVTWRLRVLWASALVVVVLGAYLVLAVLLYVQARYWLPVVYPTTAALLTHLSLVTYRGVVEQRERFRVKDVFSKVVAPDVVNELLNSESLGLGGTRKRVSVFFADIRGFTRMTDESHAQAERYAEEHGLSAVAAEEYLEAQAREILATVNLYLGVVADTIKRHHGTFDKYIGDCAMAFWGAPTPNQRHAADCVRAAIESQQAIYRLNCERAEENQRRQSENERRAEEGRPPLPPVTLLALGSGINTGVVTVGLMGSDQHILNYTVFGREVNLASRLEGISGRGRIIISESTYRELLETEPPLAEVCLALPPVSVKGFRDRVANYEVEWRRLASSYGPYDTGMITGGQGLAATDFASK